MWWRKSIMLSKLWIFFPILFVLYTVQCQTNSTNTTIPPATNSSNNSSSNSSSISNSTKIPDPEPLRTMCFISEQMRREVQIHHIIAVRNSDNYFKIFDGPDNFEPSFFYPDTKKGAGGQNMVGTKPNPLNMTKLGNKTDVRNITGAWDTTTYDFNFVVPNQAFKKYKVNFFDYTKTAGVIGMSFGSIQPSVRKWNIAEPYTCHYNTVTNNTVCISIDNRLVTVGQFSPNPKTLPNEYRFLLPVYLSFDAFFSYADSKGTDYILIHHKAQWIYRINYQEYLKNRQMFFKVFHLRTPPYPPAQFESFVFADENGLITRYLFVSDSGKKHWRYYYSLFSEVSGLATYCVHDKFINGTLMIMASEMMPPEKGLAAALRSPLRLLKRESMEIPTMLRILFYCATIYFTIFLGTQLVSIRKATIWREARRADREVQRLAPVIENIMAKVYVFMENEKRASGKKDK